MIAMDGLLNSSLLSDLSRFLRNPVIRIESAPAVEIVALQNQVQELQRKLEESELKYDKLLISYREEVHRVLHLQDICKSHRISWR